MAEFVIYGANGYTGQLIARMAAERGLSPILAGRSADAVGALAAELGLEHRAFSLEDDLEIRKGISGSRAVIHCAGPFVHTARPMLAACLAASVHYLDITGEIPVFETAKRFGRQAEKEGITLLPGVGFDAVPTDCLAAHLHKRLPEATHLALGIDAQGGVSHGTATTMVEHLHRGGMVRRDGELTPVPAAWRTRRIDFGRGERVGVLFPWGDLSTAYTSTGIPNIEVYMAMPAWARWSLRSLRVTGPVLASGPVKRFLKKRIDRAAPGPSDEVRARGGGWVWGEARDASGRQVVSRLTTPEGYTLTAMLSLDCVRRVLEGEAPTGYQTPSLAFGSDSILEFPGVTRSDEPGG